MRHGEQHGHGKHGRWQDGHKKHGAQTFRRGRALEFLQRLDIKRATLVQQLAQPEFQTINQVITGELKAIDMVRNEFIELFDLHEIEVTEGERECTEGSSEGPAEGGHEEIASEPDSDSAQ